MLIIHQLLCRSYSNLDFNIIVVFSIIVNETENMTLFTNKNGFQKNITMFAVLIFHSKSFILNIEV